MQPITAQPTMVFTKHMVHQNGVLCDFDHVPESLYGLNFDFYNAMASLTCCLYGFKLCSFIMCMASIYTLLSTECVTSIYVQEFNETLSLLL